MSAAVGGYDPFGDNLPVLHVIELELFGVPEVLKDLSVVISYRNSHIVCPFLRYVQRSLITEAIISSTEQELLAIYQCLRDFAPGTVVDRSYGCAGNTHPFSALLLSHSVAIQQTDCLKLVQAHHNGLTVRYLLGRELPMIRITADPPAALFSGHNRTSFLTYVINDTNTISDICQE